MTTSTAEPTVTPTAMTQTPAATGPDATPPDSGLSHERASIAASEERSEREAPEGRARAERGMTQRASIEASEASEERSEREAPEGRARAERGMIQQTDAAIAELRVEIDETDAALIAAVRRRIEISQQVGKLRMAAGGTRLSLAREQAIVAQYSAELGETGTSLAMLLLRAGRGRM